MRVLVVDDQAPFRMAATAVVEATDDFELVGEVETGEAAVTAARELRPDLVLMDVNLPGISGLDATREILREAADGDAHVVVVVLSTYEADEYGPRAEEAGAAGYITKSEFSPDSLEQAWLHATDAPAAEVG